MSNHGDNNETTNQLILNVGDLLNQIEIFSGVANEGPNITSFLSQVQDIADLASWTEVTKCNVARLKLRKHAAQFKNAHDEVKHTQDWERLCHLLKEQFKVKVPLLYHQQKLNSCKQLNHESCRQYASRLRSLAVKTIDLNQGTASQ